MKVNEVDGIPLALWQEAWVETGLIKMERGAAERLARRLAIATRLDEVLTDEVRRQKVRRNEAPASRHADGLPWPYVSLHRAIKKWAARDRALMAANVERWKGTKRGRGRDSRLAAFVRVMFERCPGLPTTPGPWLHASEVFGPVEEDPRRPPIARRALWRQVLRRHVKRHR